MKRFFILFWLIAAYAVVFAHSVVPHQHHKEKEHADASHHHHHEDDDHRDDSSEDAQSAFHFFQHQGNAGDYFVPAYKYKAPSVNTPVAALSYALQQLERFCREGPPLKHYKKELGYFIPQQARFYFHSVKAPPALS